MTDSRNINISQELYPSTPQTPVAQTVASLSLVGTVVSSNLKIDILEHAQSTQPQSKTSMSD